jgi:excinuclease UvrABC helicase subunit UvrB
VADEPLSARDLVRRRRGSYKAPETGRHHHIGAAPERQPLLGEDGEPGDGPQYVEAAAVQLAQRTVAQLAAQRDRTRTAMTAAAEALDFEAAARLRDALVAVEAELDRRGA